MTAELTADEAAVIAKKRARLLIIPAVLFMFAAWTLGWKQQNIDVSGHHYACGSYWDAMSSNNIPTDLGVVDVGSQSTLSDDQIYAFAVQGCHKNARDALSWAAYWGTPLVLWLLWWGRKWYNATEAASDARMREARRSLAIQREAQIPNSRSRE
jgi:hypothetical protein